MPSVSLLTTWSFRYEFERREVPLICLRPVLCTSVCVALVSPLAAWLAVLLAAERTDFLTGVKFGWKTPHQMGQFWVAFNMYDLWRLNQHGEINVQANIAS